MRHEAPTSVTSDEKPIGAPQATYRSHASISRERTLLGLCGLFGLGIARVMDVEPGEVALVIAATIVLLVAGAGGLARSLVFRTRLSVFRNGVLVESIWARAFTRWDNIEAVLEFDPPPERNWLGVEVAGYWCGFSRVDGRAFWFHVNRMSDLRGFAASIHQRVDDLIRARTLRALAAGEVVWFGYIGIGRDGLHSRKGVLPWSEIAFAGCARDTDFEVLRKGSNWAWFSKKISTVENVAMLTELIKSRRDWALPG